MLVSYLFPLYMFLELLLLIFLDGCVKDVTQRYDSNWNTETCKQRPDKQWWDITLVPYKTKDSHREQTENLQMEGRQPYHCTELYK